jgi:putative membrane protein insertion efficiency factor
LSVLANHETYPRLGLSIATRTFGTAVARNRIKRITRESFRLNQHSLPSVDVTVSAREAARQAVVARFARESREALEVDFPTMLELSQILLWMIRGYQLVLSPWLGNCCRFYPSCSCYAHAAIERTAPCEARGSVAPRNPLSSLCHEGGYDPVPDKRTINA